jgi:TrmH family RNA methyltransferase
MERIHSRKNVRIRHLVQLRKAEVRRQCGQFLIEGLRESQRAVRNSVEILDIFVSDFAVDKLQSLQTQCEQHVVSDEVFQIISARENPDGILCVGKIPPNSLPSALPDNSLVVVVERMEKPGNLGALLRTMDAVGCALLLVSDPLTDLWNPNVVRSSQGALFAVPSAVCSNEEALIFLRKNSVKIVATTPAASRTYWNALPKSTMAVVAGNEHSGLSDFWLQNSDLQVSIPMRGRASDSLNVHTATALVLYEALRQSMHTDT